VRNLSKVAVGESLPYEDNKFDAILSSDVLEHVQNLSKTMAECYRVLKPGGRFFLVFPSYFHPNEHHLSLVTYLPFIHYFFSGDILVRAYSEILEERGDEAYWYKRSSPQLESWEKGNSINGTTLALFRDIIKKNNWHIIHHSKKPIFSVGRNISQKKHFKILSYFLYPLASIPFLEEIFLARITYILEK
jgi:SAM-dependent methyltransferase